MSFTIIKRVEMKKKNTKKQININGFLWFFAIIIILILILQILSYFAVETREARLSPMTGDNVELKGTVVVPDDASAGGEPTVYLDSSTPRDGIADFTIILKCPPADQKLCDQEYNDGTELTLKGLRWDKSTGSYVTIKSTKKTIKGDT